MRWRAGSPRAAITAFVLFYRLPRRGLGGGAGRAARRRAAGDAAGPPPRSAGVDPRRVCAMGFSAGGHVCAESAHPLRAGYAPSTPPTASTPAGRCPSIRSISMSRARRPCRLARATCSARTPTPALERAHSPHLHVPADAPPDLPAPCRGRCLGAGREHACCCASALRARERRRSKPISSPTAATASASGWRGASRSNTGPSCSSPGAASQGLWT